MNFNRDIIINTLKWYWTLYLIYFDTLINRSKHTFGMIFIEFISLFLKLFYLFIYLFIFRERGREGGREGEKQQSVASYMPPTRNLGYNRGACPSQELTRQHFGLWDDAHPSEPQLSGLFFPILRWEIWSHYSFYRTTWK